MPLIAWMSVERVFQAVGAATLNPACGRMNVCGTSRSFLFAERRPLHFSRHRLSCDDCLKDKRENYQNCSVLFCAVLCMTVTSCPGK